MKNKMPSSYQVSALDQHTVARLQKIGSADIVIGIPSFNNMDSISHVIKAADLGLAKYFSNHTGIIIISEGGDVRGTQEAVNSLKDRRYFQDSFIAKPDNKTEILVTKYLGPSGKGTAIRAIFEVMNTLNARAGCMLDSDLRSISPEWIELLIAPVLFKNFGFVAPYYSRHKYDGTITNMIALPFTRSLYGRRVRQPIGGDFGFSLELVKGLLAKKVWESDIARFGIDIWMTTVAICDNFKICQSFLGAKIHDEKDPGKDLSPMFRQVVGTLFSLMNIYVDKWIRTKGSRPTAIFGFESEFVPSPIVIDVENMIRKFRESVPSYLPVWKRVMQPENCHKIEEVARMEFDYFELPGELWIKSLFDFAVAYNLQTDEQSGSEIIEALVPIYYAITASFVRKTLNLDTRQAEEIITEQCSLFEKLKPYLVERWESEMDGRAAT